MPASNEAGVRLKPLEEGGQAQPEMPPVPPPPIHQASQSLSTLTGLPESADECSPAFQRA